MGLAIKLLRHHRRFHPHPLSTFLENTSRTHLSLFADQPSILLNPDRRPDISSRSFSWFSWNRSSDNDNASGGAVEIDEDSRFGSLGSRPEFKFVGSEGGGDGEIAESDSFGSLNLVGGSHSGRKPSNLAVDGSGILEEVAGNESVWYYPVHALTSLLQEYHEFSGFPWWVIISTSTLALRLCLLPILILQLRKSQEIASFLPKLPPPFPPPLSGRSFGEQYTLFRQKRKQLGCPSYLWNFAFVTIQVPCFLIWMTTIRRMCLDHQPGFDTGGVLWFHNLTDFPSGILGSVFPILISGLHYINVQLTSLEKAWEEYGGKPAFFIDFSALYLFAIKYCYYTLGSSSPNLSLKATILVDWISFQSISSSNVKGILGLLTKYYKMYLDILAIPLLFIGFHIPQGSLVYWLTNSSLTLFQQLSLRNSFVRMKLGLHNDKDPLKKHIPTENVLPEKNVYFEVEVPLDSLSAQKLLDLALEGMAAGNDNKAIPFLELAIEKDPELVRALIAMGQILCSQGSLEEAAKYFQSAISKIHDEDDSLLVLANFGAGVSHIWQGNKLEGMKYLKRIAELKEPDSPMDKSCYHQGLVILGSTLFQEGDKSEAAKYLRIAAAYDPAVNAYVKECEG